MFEIAANLVTALPLLVVTVIMHIRHEMRSDARNASRRWREKFLRVC